ncbi:MAG: DUF5615 family PIN-like protein [Anaerolineales bacterium]|nr:DUF5615 family PIN-like protein [Anaerolineales bacterium]
MRFLVDECAGPAIADWLRGREHDIYSVYNQSPGISDDDILKKAVKEHRILITCDKDFGEKIYRDNYPHRGVILLRLIDERSSMKIAALQRVLDKYPDRLAGNFIVVSESKVRISTKR